MQLNNSFIKPRYDEGGFAGIPNRIINAFELKKYDAVVLFFVDAFGWRFYERFQDAPFIKRMAKRGKIEKLTSQFPSTTAAHVTTMHTGLPVGESGVHEWFYYEPSVDRIIAPLLFSNAGDRERDTLRSSRAKPETLYPKGIFYPALNNMGVSSFVFGRRDYTPSTYSTAVMQGAQMRSYNTMSDALVNIGELLKNQAHPQFIHFYFDKFDALCHEYGPNSPQAEAELDSFLLIMEHNFERIFHQNKKVLFLMTADHGMAEVSPQTTIFLNTHPHFSGFDRFIKKNRKGYLLTPAGSPRDMFLYIKPEALDEAQAFLATRLQGRADVVKTEWLIENTYFGPHISNRFRERVGNLVVLPYQGESVWRFEKNKFVQNYYGHHGGLTPQEMEIALYSYEIG